jgi:hypothetical protein
MSPQFHERLATIAEQFQQMQMDLAREKAAMNRTWAKREKQMEMIVCSTAKFAGELQVLYGPSLPQLRQFQLPAEASETKPRVTDVIFLVDFRNTHYIISYTTWTQ